MPKKQSRVKAHVLLQSTSVCATATSLVEYTADDLLKYQPLENKKMKNKKISGKKNGVTNPLTNHGHKTHHTTSHNEPINLSWEALN
jgi:hypothetical protein